MLIFPELRTQNGLILPAMGSWRMLPKNSMIPLIGSIWLEKISLENIFTF